MLATTPPLSVRSANTFLPPALDSVPSAESVEKQIADALTQPAQSQPMTAEECVRRAGDVSVKATLLEMELSLVDLKSRKHFQKFQSKAEEKRDLKRRILSGVARSARENAALSSLELFYSLAAAEAKLDLVGKMLSELDQAVADVERREKLGLELDVLPRDLRQQRADLLKQGVALRGGIAKINGQLEGLLDLGQSSDDRLLRPIVDWNVVFDGRTEEQVVANGLANNAELSLLRDLTMRMNPDTASTLEGFLAAIQPLLTIANEGPGSPCKFLLLLLLSPKPSEQVVETRRNQLMVYLSGKERETTAAIHDAYHDMLAAQERLSFSKEERRLAEQRVADVEKKQQESLVGQAAVSKAKIEAIRVEDTIVQQIADWYIARAKLRHAEGTILSCP